MNFSELCAKRYSARAFDRSRPVPAACMTAILEAARLAPTGCNAQQWKVLVIESAEGLRRAERCSTCVYGAPAVLLFSYDRGHPDSALEINGVDVGLTNSVIAATHAMLAAAELGVDSCWVCWFDGEETKHTFGLAENWEPACMLMLGYDKEGPGEQHALRKPLEELVERC